MTTEQFDQLIVELRAIKAALTQGRAAAPASAAKAAPAPTGDVPMPDQIIEHAEQVKVHFGKNKGVPLGKLSAKSIEWYSKDAEPRLKNDGTPFPPRAEDVLLRNAARTIIHQRHGTIPAPGPVLQPEPLNEEVPF